MSGTDHWLLGTASPYIVTNTAIFAICFQTWTASFYFRQEWTDPRLILGENAGRVKLDGDDVGKLWLPDVFFSNSKEGRKHQLTVENHLVYINASTGRMLYSQR